LGTDDTGNNGGGNGYISTYVGGNDQYGQTHGKQLHTISRNSY
jgi:hypothetical protein